MLGAVGSISWAKLRYQWHPTYKVKFKANIHISHDYL